MPDIKSLLEKIRKLIFRKNNLLVPVIIVLGCFVFLQSLRINAIMREIGYVDTKSSTLIGENDSLRGTYAQLGADLNEVRNFLRLPIKDYTSHLEEPDEDDGSENINDNVLQLALVDYIQHLGKEEKLSTQSAANEEIISGVINSENFQSFLEPRSLEIVSSTPESFTIQTKDGTFIASVSLDEEADLFLDAGNLSKNMDVKNANDLQQNLMDFIRDNQSKLETRSRDILAAVDNLKNFLLNNKGLATALGVTISELSENSKEKITYTLSNSSQENIAKVVLNKDDFSIDLIDLNDSKKSMENAKLEEDFENFLRNLDRRSLIQRKVDDTRINVESSLNDSGIQAIMKQAGISISVPPREDDERFYYEIKKTDGTVVNLLVIEKATGVVNITQPDGTNSENLLFMETEEKKKTIDLPDQIPDYGTEQLSGDGTFNILIAGKHGSLTDTMIFAHVDEQERNVKMISIPRDLFYQGRKINAYAFFYGMPELKRAVSEITGYKVDKYILIDMYAFIDVIDLLGGIDIHLDEAVIDPNYRTVDNGVVGTLHYEPGDYHLGGTEALRLARSRKTSSDFVRAERQQKIIESLQTKAKNFGFGDADTIWEIAKTVLSKTETDITLDEAIAYYFRYQNYEIVSNDVMSSGNILYVPPYITKENCAVLADEAGGTHSCQTGNQAYTLLPRDDDWNLIKWFFREHFES